MCSASLLGFWGITCLVLLTAGRKWLVKDVVGYRIPSNQQAWDRDNVEIRAIAA
jgi:hypothetical protein